MGFVERARKIGETETAAESASGGEGTFEIEPLVDAGASISDDGAPEPTAHEVAEADLNAEVGAVYRAISQYWKVQNRGPRSALLLESLLISAVSQFETFVARIISESLHFSSQLLNESGRTFSFQEVARHAGLESFIERAADDQANKLMRKPMSKWLKFLNGSLRGEYSWVDDYLNEILQRRHIHVHAGGRVSAQYIENVRDGKQLKIGKRMPVTAGYLQSALDRMALVVQVVSQASLCAIRTSKLAKLSVSALIGSGMTAESGPTCNSPGSL